jgi:hypothetical protein
MLAVGVSLLSPAVRHQWALSLVRQPARYTALAFNRAWALPATAAEGEAIPVSFTVTNHEGHVVDYRYVLSVGGGASSHVSDEATKAVADGGIWAVSTVVRPACTSSPCRVAVSLPTQNETIDFLIVLRSP